MEHYDSGFAVSIFDHTEMAWVHSRKQLSGNAISECYLCSLTLFSTLFLDSVNLEKHNIHENDIDILDSLWGFDEVQNYSSTWAL